MERLELTHVGKLVERNIKPLAELVVALSCVLLLKDVGARKITWNMCGGESRPNVPQNI